MKRLFAAIMIFVLIAAIIGMNVFGKNDGSAVRNKLQIVTSLPIIKNIAENIGGDKVTVESIVQGPRGDHEYEPSANDMMKLAKCAIFIKAGLGSDPWADKLTAGITGKNTILIDPSKNINIMRVRGLENPHYWGDPDNVKIMAHNILKGLIQAKPGDQSYFTGNYQRFIQQIVKTANELKNKVAKLPRKQMVSYTGAFPYFYRYFGFEDLMTVEISCEQEVSPKDIAGAAKLMKKKNIKVLVGNAGEPKEPEGLARETGAKVLLLWETTDSSGDYLITLRRNVEMLVTALK